ncbi:hypothetical protein [Streptomyces sp. NPDC019937]|uniref:hypothetical protein n=1 Tax=Streptomyces sp. NPDC019937 TaxID=3154787 RepID=UPI0033D82BCA
MTTFTTSPPTLTPTNDPAPVEHAVVDGILDDHDPETFLWIVFRRPDGGARVKYAWTDGGPDLGDRVDRLALAAGLDFADWLHIGGRHCQESTRGRIVVQAHPLRPVLADVQSGVRAPGDRRDGLLRVIACAAADTGQTPRPGLPRWFGMGPARLMGEAR